MLSEKDMKFIKTQKEGFIKCFVLGVVFFLILIIQLVVLNTSLDSKILFKGLLMQHLSGFGQGIAVGVAIGVFISGRRWVAIAKKLNLN